LGRSFRWLGIVLFGIFAAFTAISVLHFLFVTISGFAIASANLINIVRRKPRYADSGYMWIANLSRAAEEIVCVSYVFILYGFFFCSMTATGLSCSRWPF